MYFVYNKKNIPQYWTIDFQHLADKDGQLDAVWWMCVVAMTTHGYHDSVLLPWQHVSECLVLCKINVLLLLLPLQHVAGGFCGHYQIGVAKAR